MSAIYDKLGIGYANLRQPDARIAKQIDAALLDAKTVLNVGAGSGSYEPSDRLVTALEPSAEMIRQRSPESATASQGVAENLPFADREFDAAMAVLTVHHWANIEAGLLEMKRVAKDRVVILTFDPKSSYAWLGDYFSEMIDFDRSAMPDLEVFERILGTIKVSVVPVPHDCTDGFFGAYWRRPHAYLDRDVRAAISIFALFGDVSPALKRLENDLESGAWEDRYGCLRTKESLDVGYRLLVYDCA